MDMWWQLRHCTKIARQGFESVQLKRVNSLKAKATCRRLQNGQLYRVESMKYLLSRWESSGMANNMQRRANGRQLAAPRLRPNALVVTSRGHPPFRLFL